MINIFDKKSQFYPNLSPAERIPKVIKEYIYPTLEKEGFKILKTELSIKREVNNLFVQEIWFSKSKWNVDNEICAFTPHFSVSIKGYNRWHTKQYGEKPLNEILDGRAANYIDGWSKEFFDGNDYDLAKDDHNHIVQIINHNISKSGLPFLDTLADYLSAVDFLIREERYFKAPAMIDICLMNDDLEKAREIFNWFRKYEKTGESEFMEATLHDMQRREKIINGA